MRLERLGEVEQRLDPALQLVDLADDVGDVLAQRMVARQVELGELRRRLDAGQRVADAVRDQRRQLADGGEALGLDEARLRVAQLLVDAHQGAVRARVLHRHGALVGERAQQLQILAGVEAARLLGAERDEADHAPLERHRHEQVRAERRQLAADGLPSRPNSASSPRKCCGRRARRRIERRCRASSSLRQRRRGARRPPPAAR